MTAAVHLAPEHVAMGIVRECCAAYDVSCADRAPIHHAILGGRCARWSRSDALRVIAETTDWRQFGTGPNGPHGDLVTVLAAIVPTPDWTAMGEAGDRICRLWLTCCEYAADAERRRDEDPEQQTADEDRAELAKACTELAGMAVDR